MTHLFQGNAFWSQVSFRIGNATLSSISIGDFSPRLGLLLFSYRKAVCLPPSSSPIFLFSLFIRAVSIPPSGVRDNVLYISLPLIMLLQSLILPLQLLLPSLPFLLLLSTHCLMSSFYFLSASFLFFFLSTFFNYDSNFEGMERGVLSGASMRECALDTARGMMVRHQEEL